GIRDFHVTGVQTCALPIFVWASILGFGPTPWRGARPAMAPPPVPRPPLPTMPAAHAAATGAYPAPPSFPAVPGQAATSSPSAPEIGRASCRERQWSRRGAV